MFYFHQVRRFSQRVVLRDRSFLGISGPDAKKFVQGLCTNDLNQLKNAGDCLPTSFLTSKGRIFTNAFIYQLPSEGLQDILLEVNSKMHAELKRYLSMYKLRAKANIKALPYQGYLATTDEVPSKSANHIVASIDPRVKSYGVRIVESVTDTVPSSSSIHGKWLETRDLLFGIAEGPELANRIPLECNLDLLNYISFNKGCYVGQELTARTRFKGLVRKRLIPFLISDGSNITKNVKSFQTLAPELEESILNNAQKGIVFGSEFPSELKSKRGFRVYKNIGSQNFTDYQNQSSIGEVIHINEEGTMGLAMINLESLFAHEGDFVVLNVPKDESTEENASTAETSTNKGDEIVRYIGTFKPHWFQGLDDKTNIKV